MLNYVLSKISFININIIPFYRYRFRRKYRKCIDWGGHLSNDLSSSDNIVINDSNFNSYFDSEGYIINSEITENSTIYFDNISNRNIIIDRLLNVTAFSSNSIIFNSTFRIIDDGSGSSISNLVFNSTISGENPSYYAPILIDEASDVTVENNVIYMEYFDGCNYNLAGISVFGESLNNYIAGNRVTIVSNSRYGEKHYIYGIQITGSSIGGEVFARNNPKGNVIKYNVIDIDSEYYASGIYTSFIQDTVIDNNEIDLRADEFTYAIVCDYFSASTFLETSTNITISNNNVKTNSSMSYMIEIFNIDNINIFNNTLFADANASYGISGYSCNYHNVFNNHIIVNGISVNAVGFNVDAIATGHNGIYYMTDSSNIEIHDNNILSNYMLCGDYAIRFDASTFYNINVYDNNLTSNNATYNGNDAVYGNVNIHDNHPFNADLFNVNYTRYITYDIYVDVGGDDVNGNASADNPFATLNRAITYLKILTMQNTNRSVGIKGIVYMGDGIYSGFGSNLRMQISGLNIEIKGSQNTTIDGGNSNWFFEISDDSTVSLENINFINGIYRSKDSGLILNNGFLTLTSCNFSYCRANDLSAIIYNNGILRLSKNNLSQNKVKNQIYNTGKIDNLVIDFIGNSSETNVLLINSSYVPLTAYVHDDMGNLISGGYVKFYIEGKEVYTTGNVVSGVAKSNALVALTGSLKVSGFYSNSYSNTFINLGIINSTIIRDGIVFYVSVNGSDEEGIGSEDNPFKTINKVFSLGSPTSQMIIYLSEGNFKENLGDFKSAYTLTICGVENETYILSDWMFNNENVKLENLIFNKARINATNTNLEINNCYFTNAYYTPVTSVGGTLLVVDSTFKDNCVRELHNYNVVYKERDWGGAIYKAFGNLTVVRCLFDGNEATHGGAIYSNQSDLYISKSKFINNLALAGLSTYCYSSGGAILQYLGREVVISDTSFESNSASSYGGAFYSLGIHPYKPLKPGYYIDGASYLNSEIERGYVGELDSPQDIYFINCNFTNNLAPLGGGAVFIANNSFTEYIGCRFDSNLAYTYDVSVSFSTFRMNWITYDYYKDNIESLYLVEKNYGGAIFDKNLHVSDSYFEANTYDSGGSLLLPSVLSGERELEFISRHDVGTSINSVSNGEEIYISDSSILTSEDSKFLGISGWSGSYDGPSINKQIKDYSRPDNGNGNGDGDGGSESGGNGEGSGSGSGSGNGEGSGSSQGHSLTMGDIFNYLSTNGDNLVSNNGNGISLNDIVDMLNNNGQDKPISPNNGSSAENTDNLIEVNSSSERTQQESGGHISNGQSVADVGDSSDPLTGVSDDGSADSSDVSSSEGAGDSSPSSSSPSDEGSSSGAYEVSKKMDAGSFIDNNNNVWYSFLIVIILCILLIFGYKSRKYEEE